MKSKIIILGYLLIVPFFSSKAQFFLNKEEILLNNGSKYANSYKVELRFKIEDDSVESMLVSNMPDFQGAHWVDYQSEILDWTLDFNDGLQEVFAKFRYENGEESEIFTDEIIIDTTPPQNASIKIDVPSKHTNDNSFVVDILLSALDAKYVMISNQPSFYAKRWRLFKDDMVPEWRLEQGDDGPRTVYVKFRDKAGNESGLVSDQIIIDTKAPFDVHTQVNKGNLYITSQAKELQIDLFARGADSIKIAVNDESFGNALWEAYQTSWSNILEDGEGKKVIYIKFKDLAGNESEIFTHEVILDTTPPTNGEVLINNGAESTNQLDKLVTLNLRADDAKYFKVSNNPLQFDNARWHTFETLFEDWKLEGEGDGMRTVYVKFKDAAGNVSKTYTASIMLERGF